MNIPSLSGPFGMQMPKRHISSESYRYGFNGKEVDGEWSGNGNSYDYGFRIYNPRLGRFLSVDPIAIELPWNSPYVYAENDVIRSIDLEGLEKFVVINDLNKNGQVIGKTLFRILDNEGNEVNMKLQQKSTGDKVTLEDVTSKDVLVLERKDGKLSKPENFEKDKLDKEEALLRNSKDNFSESSNESRKVQYASLGIVSEAEVTGTSFLTKGEFRSTPVIDKQKVFRKGEGNVTLVTRKMKDSPFVNPARGTLYNFNRIQLIAIAQRLKKDLTLSVQVGEITTDKFTREDVIITLKGLGVKESQITDLPIANGGISRNNVSIGRVINQETQTGTKREFKVSKK